MMGLSQELAQEIEGIGYDPVSAAFAEPGGVWLGPPEGVMVEAAVSPPFNRVVIVVRTWEGEQPRFTPLEAHRNSSVRRADLRIDRYEYHLARFKWAGQLIVEDAFGPAWRDSSNTRVWSTQDLRGSLSSNGDLHVARILPTIGEAEQLLNVLGQGAGMSEPDAASMAQLTASLASRGSQELQGPAT